MSALASGTGKPVVVLLGNYPPDRQESMLRFCDLLQEGLQAAGYDVVLISPTRVFRGPAQKGEWAKWLGYIDKYVLFPARLSRQLSGVRRQYPGRKIVIHICDHSNSVYARQARKRYPVLITCHDLIAVRSARGEDVACRTGPFGKVLQGAIFRGLGDASAIACVSNATRFDLTRLGGENLGRRSSVIPLALNYPYRPMAREEAMAVLAQSGINLPYHGFVLHVGSGEPRKNRKALLFSVETIAHEWNGHVVFAGENWTEEERLLTRKLGLESRIQAVVQPANKTLCALYNAAHALVFMSIAEGFGWPVLEAQATGCPVICSNRTAVPEVAGDGALIHDPDDYAGVGQEILRLQDESVRGQVVALGISNAARYSIEQMLTAYEDIYESI